MIFLLQGPDDFKEVTTIEIVEEILEHDLEETVWNKKRKEIFMNLYLIFSSRSYSMISLLKGPDDFKESTTID